MEYGAISDKQREILDFIKAEIRQKGYPPAVREICSAVGLKSTASVHSHLSKLESSGYIKRDPTKSRTIEIIEDHLDAANAVAPAEYAQVPMVGYVAAGEPLLAEQNINDYFPIPTHMLPNEQVFMLKVRGDSMINAGIFNGDQVLVKQTNTASNGDMVVALVGEGATVKTFYKEKGHFRLQPENDDYEPIIVDEVQILGQVIGVFRMF